mmetsp:Transcript_96576/g.300377  ORF Transcript_96576/g.300377 Transcript_96576/m.300377 type:complete len:236 (-) Transcript_96576:96-803(-)
MHGRQGAPRGSRRTTGTRPETSLQSPCTSAATSRQSSAASHAGSTMPWGRPCAHARCCAMSVSLPIQLDRKSSSQRSAKSWPTPAARSPCSRCNALAMSRCVSCCRRAAPRTASVKPCRPSSTPKSSSSASLICQKACRCCAWTSPASGACRQPGSASSARILPASRAGTTSQTRDAVSRCPQQSRRSRRLRRLGPSSAQRVTSIRRAALKPWSLVALGSSPCQGSSCRPPPACR